MARRPANRGRAILKPLLTGAEGRPPVIREPRAFRATWVEGLGLFHRHGDALWLAPLPPTSRAVSHLPWTRQAVRLIA